MPDCSSRGVSDGDVQLPPRLKSSYVGPALLVTTCWWASFARLAHLLVMQGCNVSVLCPPGHAALAVPGITVFRQQAFRSVAALSAAIAKCRPVMLVPGDDRAVGHMHQLHRMGTAAERALVERSLGPSLGYPVATSRVLFAVLARRLGIAVPEDAVVKTQPALEAWLDRVPGPWVVKANGASAGAGVRIATTREEAFGAFRTLRRRKLLPALKRLLINRDPYSLSDWWADPRPEVSVQRHVVGCPGNTAIFCQDGEVLAATTVDAVECIGATGPSTIVRLVDRPSVTEDARTLARHMRLTGFYGLDFMVEQATGRIMMIELNPRATSLANIRLARSGDLIGCAASLFTGKRCLPPATPPNAELVAHFPLALHWKPDDPRLATCFQDIPAETPALVVAMLRPSWPYRPLQARLAATTRRFVLLCIAQLS